MLTVTQNALSAIERLTTRPGIPPGTGLRISRVSGGEFDLSLEPAPAPGDAVLDLGAVRVFLPADTADVLDRDVLDAHDEDGLPDFFLTSA